MIKERMQDKFMFCMDNRTQQQQWEFGDQISTSPHSSHHLSLVVSSMGVALGSQVGTSVSTAGDFNADGLSDVLIGAPLWNSSQGKVFVVFGKAKSQAITPLFLNNLSSNTAIEFVGESINKQLLGMVSEQWRLEFRWIC